jgi:hypothetical protein
MHIATIPAAVIAALWLAPAQARTDYPFCALGGKTSEGMSCDFATLAQCQAATSGAGGSCIANPRARQAPRASDTPSPGRR